MWKTYPQRLSINALHIHITYVCCTACGQNVENLSTAIVDKFSAYTYVIRISHDMWRKCGKLIHRDCGKLRTVEKMWKTYPHGMWITALYTYVICIQSHFDIHILYVYCG